MRHILRRALAALAFGLLGTQAFAQVTLYEHDNFGGAARSFDRAESDLRRSDFNDRASSAVVHGGSWQLCSEGGFRGRCVTLRPGRYDGLGDLNDQVSSLRPMLRGGEQPIAGERPGWREEQRERYNDRRYPERGQLILFEHANFEGRSVRVDRDAGTLDFAGFNDRASSIVVNAGRWQVCSDAEFRGSCRVLTPGRYDNLAAMGLNDNVSSLRLIGPGHRVRREEYSPEPRPWDGF